MGNFYRLLADVAGVAIILGIIGMAIRRFILRPKTLSTRELTLLLPKARFGILRDSAIVAAFIFIHNMGRLLGESFYVAATGAADPLAAGHFHGGRLMVRHESEHAVDR